jgi:hypothetical protein
LEVDSGEKNQGYLSALHDISEPEAGENIVETKSSKIPNSNTPTSQTNSTNRKISARPKRKTHISVSHLYTTPFFRYDIAYASFKEWYQADSVVD